MPDLTPIELALLTATAFFGVVAGWLLRASRCAREKQAINAGWRDQINAQKSEHSRLADQNKSLMEQISQNQVSRKDSDLRARELSESLREAFARRDELQRQLKDIRSNLESAIAERNRLQSDADQQAVRQDEASRTLHDKDQKIARLGRELENWQSRLPPLIERFRVRDLEAQQLEIELQQARQRIADFESLLSAGETRVEPAESSSLANGLDASNEQYDLTSEHDVSVMDPATDVGQSIDEPGETADGFDAAGSSVFDTLLADDTDDEVIPETDEVDEVFAEASSGDTHIDVALDGSDGTGNLDYELPESPGGDPDRDDLQSIKGVGPAIEKTLNELGVFRFEQIATMSEFEIDRVARQLKGFRSRIYREDWIGQARLLMQQKDQDQT